MQSRDVELRSISPQSPVALGADCRPHRRPDVRARAIDGETVVLDRTRGFIHQLNHTANFIWDHCDGQATLTEIACKLAEAFDVDAQIAAVDTAKTVQQLYQLNLLIPDAGKTRASQLAIGEEAS